VESTLFANAGTMEEDCVMENSEAIVAVKMAISIRDISQTHSLHNINIAYIAALHDNWCLQGFILEYLCNL